VLNHKDYENRAAFDEAIHEKLTTAQIDIVCLAGFMRILTGDESLKFSRNTCNKTAVIYYRYYVKKHPT